MATEAAGGSRDERLRAGGRGRWIGEEAEEGQEEREGGDERKIT